MLDVYFAMHSFWVSFKEADAVNFLCFGDTEFLPGVDIIMLSPSGIAESKAFLRFSFDEESGLMDCDEAYLDAKEAISCGLLSWVSGVEYSDPEVVSLRSAVDAVICLDGSILLLVCEVEIASEEVGSLNELKRLFNKIGSSDAVSGVPN